MPCASFHRATARNGTRPTKLRGWYLPTSIRSQAETYHCESRPSLESPSSSALWGAVCWRAETGVCFACACVLRSHGHAPPLAQRAGHREVPRQLGLGVEHLHLELAGPILLLLLHGPQGGQQGPCPQRAAQVGLSQHLTMSQGEEAEQDQAATNTQPC